MRKADLLKASIPPGDTLEQQSASVHYQREVWERVCVRVFVCVCDFTDETYTLSLSLSLYFSHSLTHSLSDSHILLSLSLNHHRNGACAREGRSKPKWADSQPTFRSADNQHTELVKEPHIACFCCSVQVSQQLEQKGVASNFSCIHSFEVVDQQSLTEGSP